MQDEKITESVQTKDVTDKLKRSLKIMQFLSIGSVVLMIILIAFIFLQSGGSTTGNFIKSLSTDEVGNKTIEFINKNLVSTGSASLVSVEESNGLYKVTVSYQNQDIPLYVSKDGTFLFQGAIDMTKSIETTTTEPQEVPKTDKPAVQLFVMAFCPYGIQAEDAMKPVVDLLGSKADIKVHFIASVGGTTPDSVQSLHGAVEAQEDLRQVCIMKYYDQKAYWNYLMTINANCSSLYRDASYDACWKNAATKAGIDYSKIDTCSKGSEGMNLIKADADLASANSVSGSPTLLINGVRYSGARTPDAYKEGICNAFTTEPSECSQQLSSTGSTTSGGCAT